MKIDATFKFLKIVDYKEAGNPKLVSQKQEV